MALGTSQSAQRCGVTRSGHELPFGGRLGDYVLLEQVGTGRWSRVFRAVHRDGKGLKAIKVLPHQRLSETGKVIHQTATKSVSLRMDQAQCAADVALLKREAEIAAFVQHPKLVVVEEAQLERPPYYLVLEWIEGQPLAQLIRREGKLVVPLALWIARQVAEALCALCRVGFIHGDVKPQNILIGRHGAVKLVDLGLSRRPEATPGLNASGPPLVPRALSDFEGMQAPSAPPLVGTANYMAPELAAGMQGGDVRSDIYSLGVTLYEMLTGRLPFVADDMAQVLIAQRRFRPPCPRSAAPFLTPPLAALLRRMLAKQPLRRPNDPTELIGLLRRQEIEWLDYRNSA